MSLNEPLQYVMKYEQTHNTGDINSLLQTNNYNNHLNHPVVDKIKSDVTSFAPQLQTIPNHLYFLDHQ